MCMHIKQKIEQPTFIDVFLHMHIRFLYVTSDEVTHTYNEVLSQRFSSFQSIPGVRQYHKFQPTKSGDVEAFLLSGHHCPKFTYQPLRHTTVLAVEHQFNLDDWVAVIFNEQWYIGNVTSVNGPLITVKFMRNTGCNRYMWPARDDIATISGNSILAKINVKPDLAETTSSARQVIYQLDRKEYLDINTTFLSIMSKK